MGKEQEKRSMNDDPVMRVGAFQARSASLKTVARRMNDDLVLSIAALVTTRGSVCDSGGIRHQGRGRSVVPRICLLTRKPRRNRWWALAF